MTIKIQIRRATLAAFVTAGVILAMGEPAFTTDTKDYRIGDGVTAFADLAVFSKASDLNAILENQATINASQLAQITENSAIIANVGAALNRTILEYQENDAAIVTDVYDITVRVTALESIPPLTVIDGGTA